MNSTRLVGVISLIVFTFVIGGCINAVNLTSTRDKSYQYHLRKTLIVTNTADNALDIGSPTNMNFYAKAIDYLKTFLEKDGIVVQVIKTDPAVANQKELIERAQKQLMATTVLSINVGNREVSNYHPLWGRWWSQTFEIQMSLTDVESQKIVWNSSFKVAQDYNIFIMSKNMEEIANRIVVALKEDNLI